MKPHNWGQWPKTTNVLCQKLSYFPSRLWLIMNNRLVNKTYNRGFGIVFGYNLRSVTTTSNQLCLRRESLLSNHFCDFDFNQYFFQADLDSWQKDKGYQGSRFIIVLHYHVFEYGTCEQRSTSSRWGKVSQSQKWILM